MKNILFVTILNLFCLVSLMVAKPLDNRGNYTESVDKQRVSIVTDKNLAHDGKSYKANNSIEIQAKEIKVSGSTYRSQMIALVAALGITLSKSNFDGVLSLDGNKITIRDCVIKSLAITHYEKVIVELLGKTVIEEGVQFIGDPGIINAESSVRIEGGIVNGVKKSL